MTGAENYYSTGAYYIAYVSLIIYLSMLSAVY